MVNIKERKFNHIQISLKHNVEAKSITTLLEHIHLIHNALPELNMDEIDTSTTFLNYKFNAPILIDAITGGTQESLKINATLSLAAEKLGLGMVVGSQKAALKSPEVAETYSIVRKNAPNAFIATNIGASDLITNFTISDAEKLIDMIKANAFVIHLNPLQELIQPEGVSRYKGVLVKIRELTSQLKVPVIVKEVGAGISKEVAIKLELAGVSAINIAGAGGTSWAGVEQIRGEAEGNKVKSRLGLLYWDWGIPTAVSLIEVRKAVKIPIIASGGLRNGLDIAKCMVLGADLCGMALPMLKYAVKSLDDLIEFIQNTILELKVAMYLVGAGNLKALRNVRYVITSPLTEWLKS
ncbi:MAG: type 2 isopentenyl-diphosphate Delta-isomerase [Nitrososphaerales archaeon]